MNDYRRAAWYPPHRNARLGKTVNGDLLKV
jgi:hypothetical protein